jgi:hypothetical protein
MVRAICGEREARDAEFLEWRESSFGFGLMQKLYVVHLVAVIQFALGLKHGASRKMRTGWLESG